MAGARGKGVTDMVEIPFYLFKLVLFQTSDRAFIIDEECLAGKERMAKAGELAIRSLYHFLSIPPRERMT
jgi:hypothetical protein